jgi:hypothetical protein
LPVLMSYTKIVSFLFKTSSRPPTMYTWSLSAVMLYLLNWLYEGISVTCCHWFLLCTYFAMLCFPPSFLNVPKHSSPALKRLLTWQPAVLCVLTTVDHEPPHEC